VEKKNTIYLIKEEHRDLHDFNLELQRKEIGVQISFLSL